ncbi:hypothetical protein [Streptomyces sp. NPDC047108]|uniref:hypothetical protein n=1 Tax=Streptomyces sp. NPDC047108 TaxID=3155025 RepID=UPI0033E32F37
MNPPSGQPAPHLDPSEANKGQGKESERAATERRSQRRAARRVVAGHAKDPEDLAFLLEALELQPETDGRTPRPGRGDGTRGADGTHGTHGTHGTDSAHREGMRGDGVHEERAPGCDGSGSSGGTGTTGDMGGTDSTRSGT